MHPFAFTHHRRGGAAASPLRAAPALGLMMPLILALALCAGALGSAFAQDGRTPTATQFDPHAEVFRDTEYPSAVQCASCHQRIFWEWASSNHAYASISPMFHKFEQTISDLSSGTIGTFCVRCHQQVGTQRGEARELPLWQRSTVAREGITCITCHRVGAEFGKVNGSRHVRPGTIYDPVYNTGGPSNFPTVVADPDLYGISGDRDDPGTPIHSGAIEFSQIGRSEFCVSCHQVAVHPGIKLEVVWEQYRASPAAKAGVQCQDCHMGKTPGVADGYDTWPTAIVNGRIVGDPNAKHSNHAFYGPGYPIAHPGIFPFNPRALKWSIDEWLLFDWHTPWGVPEWEERLARGANKQEFPAIWASRKDRETARYVIDQNLRLLDQKRRDRIAVMENAMRIDGPFFDRGTPQTGKNFAFRYRITNVDDGHNLPSGSLGAQPELWLNVVLTGPDGEIVFESGYVDSHGDMADLHSLDVAAGKVKHDNQLWNLQTKFLTTNVKGTDREMYLPVNFDIDQRPFLRPSGVPSSVLNHPPFIRMEGRSLPPLATRDATYKVDGSRLTKPGIYKLSVRMRSRAEPIYFMKFVNSTKEMERAMNEWMIDIHPSTVEFEVK